MKFKSVSTKLNIAISGISLLSLVIGFFVLFWYSHKIENNVYKSTKMELINNANDKIESKMRVGITNAISIANDERIKNALKNDERVLAINSLKEISINMKKFTDFKNIKIHLHTKDNKSFLRNWKLNKYGDDLSSFRASVVSVNRTLIPMTTFEPGRAGLLIRALTPIISGSGEHLGSLEFMQGINSVVKALEKSNQELLLLMENSVEKNIKTGKNFSFKNALKFKNYIISQKYINREFLADAQSLNMKKLLINGTFISSKYFYTYMDINDFENKKLGIALLAKPLSIVNSAVDGAKTIVYLSLCGILGMIVLISIVIVISIKKLVIEPLKKFENGLLDFFLFLQGKKDYTENLDINTNDEFGVMAKSLKENIAVSARLHEEINELNTNLEAKVEEKTKKVTTLLDNAGQGFLSFGCDFIVDEEYSMECNKLLGDKIAGMNIADLLFNSENKKTFFKETLLNANEMSNLIAKKSILSLLPNEIILKRKALKLDYKMLENGKLMLVITNISSQKKLERKIKREQETLKMIVEIVSESDSFYDTKRDYEEFISSYEEHINLSKTSLHNISAIYRTIHTFKGAFAQLYMNSIVDFLHSVESEISQMIKENKHTNEALLALIKKYDFKTNLTEVLEIIQNILGEDFLNSQSIIKISESEVQTLQDKICSMFEKENLESIEAKDIITKVTNLSNQRLLTLLKPYPHLVEQLASRLEKEVYEFEIIGNKKIVVQEKQKPFIKSLLHVFRNSVDHGIEDPETRLENSKDEVGTITCSFEKEDDTIEIIISDDGAGIDKDKVLAKALYQNIIRPEQSALMSDNEIYSLIFSENFSTKDEVSDISGRGVGMNAVKYELEKIGGTIKINTQKNSGTSFIFTIPV